MNPLKKVINGGFCIGCGICTVNNNSSYRIKLDENGKYQADYNSNENDTMSNSYYNSICPFSGESINENEIAKGLYSNSPYNKKIGYYKSLFAGHVSEGNIRKDSSSGGMVTWVVKELFERKDIDYVVHVTPAKNINNNYNTLIQYSISKSKEEAYKEKSKSSYYPVQMSDVLKKVISMDGKFAIVGIPCFIKGIRLICNNNEELNKKIKYTIGIVCGHLKSKYYGEFLAWQKGIESNNLTKIDFRQKIDGRKASDFGMKFSHLNENKIVDNQYLNKGFFGMSWAYGFFMYSACNFCDDVLAETADITLGDAWLNPYVNDYRGSNIIVVRNSKLVKILEEGRKNGKLKIDNLSEEQIISTQSGCFRMRNEGLAARINHWRKSNKWFPVKRVKSDDYKLTKRESLKYLKRVSLMEQSYKYFKKAKSENNIKIAISAYKTLIHEYDKLNRSAFRRFGSFVKRKLKIFNNK